MQPQEKLVDDTAGRHDLLKLLESITQEELEAATGIPQTLISFIKNRQRLPSRKTATALTKVGIAFDRWDVAPEDAA